MVDLNVYQRIWHHLAKVPGGYRWVVCTGWVRERRICLDLGERPTHSSISRKEAARRNLRGPSPSNPCGWAGGPDALQAAIEATNQGGSA